MDKANPNARFAPDDIFERVAYAKHAMQLINHYPDEKGACTVAIDAPWGMGKSTFIHMWRNELIARNQAILQSAEDGTRLMGFEADPFFTRNLSFYYNAWENDFCEDAFLPLIYTICGSAELTSDPSKDNEPAKSSFKKLISATTGALSAIGCFAASENALLAGQIGSVANNFVNHIFKCFSAGTPEAVKDSFQKTTAVMNAFREALEEFAAEYGKLFIFIDELDRCKPSFAVKTLETIKHFFDVPNVVFVFAVDSIQLAQTIKGAYSANIDAGSYLSKFFTYYIHLPAPTTVQLLKHSGGKSDYSIELEHMITDALSLSGTTPREAAYVIRNAEKIYISYQLALLDNDAALAFAFFILLFAIKVKHPEMYSAIFQGQANWDTLGWHASNSELSQFVDYLCISVNQKIREANEIWYKHFSNAEEVDRDRYARILGYTAKRASPNQFVRDYFQMILDF